MNCQRFDCAKLMFCPTQSFSVPRVQQRGKYHAQPMTASCPTGISFPTNRTSTFNTIHSDQSTSSSDAVLTSGSRPGALTQSTHSKGPRASPTAGMPNGRPSTPQRTARRYLLFSRIRRRMPVQSRRRARPALARRNPHAACTSGHIDLEQRRVARGLGKTRLRGLGDIPFGKQESENCGGGEGARFVWDARIQPELETERENFELEWMEIKRDKT
ncbi:hypothetical protein F4810DRAFT_708400 [Camillea tinctor]|nr:hypothetical protein F4810DRAFT_708400 [Camillea tinctor]